MENQVEFSLNWTEDGEPKSAGLGNLSEKVCKAFAYGLREHSDVTDIRLVRIDANEVAL